MNISFPLLALSFLSFCSSLALMKKALALADFLLCSAQESLVLSFCLLKRMTLSYKHRTADYSANAHQVCSGKSMTAH